MPNNIKPPDGLLNIALGKTSLLNIFITERYPVKTEILFIKVRVPDPNISLIIPNMDTAIKKPTPYFKLFLKFKLF